MRLLLLNIFMMCSVTLAMPGSPEHDDDVNISLHTSVQNGNVVSVSRRRLNGQDKQIVEVSSFRIKIDGDNFDCGSLKCPKETFKCHMTSEAVANDRKKMKTTAECQTKEGQVLKKDEYVEDNPHPTIEPPYSRVATVDREGTIDIEDSTGNHQTFGASKPMTKEQKAEFNTNMRRMEGQMKMQSENFNRQMESFNRNMEVSMNNMQNQMAATFGNNFPFGDSNPFGGNFPFGNSNPFTHFQPYDPFANFHTFFYPTTNNYAYVPRVYGYTNSYDYYQPESLESNYAVEEFKPVYRSAVAPNRNDKYRYAY